MTDETQIRFIIGAACFIAGAIAGVISGEITGRAKGWAQRGMAEMRRNSIAAQMRRDRKTGRYRKWPLPQRVFADHLESSQHTKDL